MLLRTVNSLKQLYTMSMDVHARFRTEAHQDVVGRFNERFLMQHKTVGYSSLIILLLDSYYLLLRASVVSLLTTS